MARVNHLIAHLIHTDPKAAKQAILDALEAEKMVMGQAAAHIGCTHGTLLVWIAKLDMSPAVEKLRLRAMREGWLHIPQGGRPKMTAKARAEALAAREAKKAAMTPAEQAKDKAARKARREAMAKLREAKSVTKRKKAA
jgi:DNA primase large subunit